MKKFLIFCGFLIGMTCQAQLMNFSFQASANCPVIKDVETEEQTIPVAIPPAAGYASYVTTGTVRESFTPKIGFNFGGRFDYPLSTKFFLSSGLSISYVRFQRTVEVTRISPDLRLELHDVPATVGLPFGSIYSWSSMRDPEGNIIVNPQTFPLRSEDIGKTTTLSIQAPLLLGTSFLEKKLEVRTGAVFSYLLHATQIKDQFVASTQSFSDYKDSSKDGFKEFQAGMTVQTTYRIGQHVGLNFEAQKFFTPIYESDARSAGDAKYNVLSLGLSYHL